MGQWLYALQRKHVVIDIDTDFWEIVDEQFQMVEEGDYEGMYVCLDEPESGLWSEKEIFDQYLVQEGYASNVCETVALYKTEKEAKIAMKFGMRIEKIQCHGRLAEILGEVI